MTKHFTDAERRAGYAESQRLLRDPPAPHERAPEPPREVPPPMFEDELDRWRREADEADAVREQCRAELRRESRENERVLTALERISALEARVAAAEQLAAHSDD